MKMIKFTLTLLLTILGFILFFSLPLLLFFLSTFKSFFLFPSLLSMIYDPFLFLLLSESLIPLSFSILHPPLLSALPYVISTSHRQWHIVIPPDICKKVVHIMSSIFIFLFFFSLAIYTLIHVLLQSPLLFLFSSMLFLHTLPS